MYNVNLNNFLNKSLKNIFKNNLITTKLLIDKLNCQKRIPTFKFASNPFKSKVTMKYI